MKTFLFKSVINDSGRSIGGAMGCVCLALTLTMCTASDDLPDETTGAGEVGFRLSLATDALTKINDQGTDFNIGDPFIICNTEGEPNPALTDRYFVYKYTKAYDPAQTGQINCEPRTAGSALIWKNIQRYGNNYFFTATSSPKIEEVQSDQSALNKLVASDFLVARQTVRVSDRGKPIHLKFHHVLCKVEIEVYVPLGDMDFRQDALTEAAFIERQTEFSVTYSASKTDPDEIMSASAKGTKDRKIVPYTLSNKVKEVSAGTVIEPGKYQIYTYTAILPQQETALGQPFARLQIDGKSYIYRPSEGNAIQLKQGKITQIRLRIVRSSAKPIELGPVRVKDWLGTTAHVGELEPQPQP